MKWELDVFGFVLQEFLVGVVPFVPFLCRETGNGSLLGRRWEEVDATECSDRTLSRLDVRLNVEVNGVVEATGTGISDGRASESPKQNSFNFIF